MSEPDPQLAKASRARRRWLLKSLVMLVLAPALVLGCLYGGRNAWHWWQARTLAHLNDEAEAFYAKRNLEGAMRTLGTVMQKDPFNERGLRLWARILDDSPHNPEDALAVWRKLCSTPHATAADEAALGLALLRTGLYKESRAIWEHLPPSEQKRRHGLELESALLSYEGKTKEAEQILRRAYESDTGDPDSRLKLAVLDLKSSFPDIKDAAAKRVWDIAEQSHGAVAVRAMQVLASMPGLSVTQAEKLLARLAKMPDVTGAPRYEVLGGCLKALPGQRDPMLDQEMARHKGKLGDESVAFLQWLLTNHEGARVLTLLDQETAIHSTPLFAVYVQALNVAERWKELEQLLRSPQSPPLSPAASAVMLAHCSYKLGYSRANTLNLLKEALHYAHSRNSVPELYMIGTSADELGFNDLALDIYTEVSEHRAYKINALDHILQIHRREGKLNDIIGTLETLLQDAPGRAPYLDMYCYHKILAGDEMEKTAAVVQHTLNSGRQSSPTLHLTLALAAYRAHNLDAALKEAETISSDELPAGQRAVLAGIFEACGKAGEAFRLAEKISPRLLLGEETRFLNAAL
jgi:tetratricopeptide (TPR) repeat protein